MLTDAPRDAGHELSTSLTSDLILTQLLNVHLMEVVHHPPDSLLHLVRALQIQPCYY